MERIEKGGVDQIKKSLVRRGGFTLLPLYNRCTTDYLYKTHILWAAECGEGENEVLYRTSRTILRT